MTDIISKALFANSIPAELAELAQKAGLVDHQQIVRFMEIHETLATSELVDITDMTDVQPLAMLGEALLNVGASEYPPFGVGTNGRVMADTNAAGPMPVLVRDVSMATVSWPVGT